MREITQLYLSPLRKTIPVGGFPPLRPLPSLRQLVSMCSLSTKAQIKGYYLRQIQGQTLDVLWVFYSVQNFYHRKFIQPHDDWITNPATRWLHHTVGFSFFTTTTFKDLVYGQSSSYWQRLRVSSSRGFFLFYHYNLQGSCLRTVIQPLTEAAGLLISWVFPFLP